jgi:UPF0755 protein
MEKKTRKQGIKKDKNVTGKFIAIIILLIIILGATAVFSFNYFITKKLEPVGNGKAIIIEIKEGFVLSDTAEILKENNLIQDELAFELLAKKEKKENLIQSGSYEISPTESSEEILNHLVNGEVYDFSVTIPEGKNIHEMGDILEENNVCSAADFVEEATKVEHYQKFYPILNSISLESKDGYSRTLEGYLFPDTYGFKPNIEASEVIETMLNRFVEIFNSDYIKQTEKTEKTIDEIVILSSIIELETKYLEDKPLAASVFYNRLAIDQPLQSDITVDYARGERNAILTTEQTQFDSPYNTYIHPGLPFGPICSFGKLSLEAALYPTDTNYYYFVADIETGKTYFNETYEEHLVDVEKYLGDY